MGDVSSGNTIVQGLQISRNPTADAVDAGRPRFKTGVITAPATTDNGDTIVLDMYAAFGITKLLAIDGFIHTTAESVIVEEDPTTAVTGTTLTITVGGATPNKERTYIIYGI